MASPGDEARGEAEFLLGNDHYLGGRMLEAEKHFARALALVPRNPAIHLNLGATLVQLGRPDEAERHLREATALDPGSALPLIALGSVLANTERLEEAAEILRAALTIDPDNAMTMVNLASFSKDLGQLAEAERLLRRARDLDPAYALGQSNLAFLQNYLPGRSAEDIFAEHLEYGRRFGAAGADAPRAGTADPARRLRIGYVSSDFRNHSVAFFIESVLESHDRKACEITCYANIVRPDAVGTRLRGLADRWRDVAGLDDAALAALIRADGIDILVDLNGHTSGHRLGALACKPAPVQATWLGYLNTTGLAAFDWRIVDALAAPPGLLERFHSEKLMRMPHSQWCYRPPAEAPAVQPPPSASAGYVTFGVLSVPAKINERAIALWAKLLERVPDSLLQVVMGTSDTVPEAFVEQFHRGGIAGDNLQVLGRHAFDDYLALHGGVDIVLDTFPYCGGTTSSHALWMGVPVVTLVGETATSRGGASLLGTIGLHELIAQTPEQYVDIAAGLANDPARLAALRAGMRERMRTSPLLDAKRFTRDLEQAYRAMWRDWCAAA